MNTGERHKELHRALDELLACFVNANPGKGFSKTTLFELMEWSHAVTKNPALCPQHDGKGSEGEAGKVILTPLQRRAMRAVLIKVGSWTHARFDQHLRNDVGDAEADAIMKWVESELGLRRNAERDRWEASDDGG